MKRIFLNEVSNTMMQVARLFDGIKLPEPRGATQYQKGPLSFLTCGFPGYPNCSLRVMVYRPILNEEFVCHARLSFRPCSAFEVPSTYDLGYKELRDLLRGTGVRTIDTAGKQIFADFFHLQDVEFLEAYRTEEFNLQVENVMSRAA